MIKSMMAFIEEGEQIPSFYRIAYWEWERDAFVAYPVGLHWIVRLMRRIWGWSLCYRPDRLEQLVGLSYEKGRQEGIKQTVVVFNGKSAAHD